MYQISREHNNIFKLEERLFGELGFREREHLQEWIAKNPDVLGEDFLIIQKEFDGFSETNERLDLLALDKEGNLVIIENKLDDTGRDVVWQALKYASYCSTLSTSQIINIFQLYLDKHVTSEDAKAKILEFMELENEDELLLNKNDQRIIFVANHYRKEVTSTVMWMLNHDLQIQCFKATPYSLGDGLFLQVAQIIPLPETKEFVIEIKEKEKEENSRNKSTQIREARLLQFWTLLKKDFQENNIHLLDSINPNSAPNMGFGSNKALFSMVIGKRVQRVEVYFPDDENKELFDAMLKNKDALENQFIGNIIWERLEGKKASRIKHEMDYDVAKEYGLFRDGEYLNERIEWFRAKYVEFYNVVSPLVNKIHKEL